jgi:hypothetical protein
VSTADPARPPFPLENTGSFCKLVESWVDAANHTRTLHVYTNAAMVGVAVSGGGAVRSPTLVPMFSAAVFDSVPFTPGSVTASCFAADGTTVLATDTAHTPGAAAKIILTIDAPTPRTGTGEALYLDGGDVAMLRATVVDGNGNPCTDDSSTVVHFTVTNGPGVVIGVGNVRRSGCRRSHCTMDSATNPRLLSCAHAM